MPIVKIDLLEGRPIEKIETMISAVSEAVASSLDAQIDTVRVIVNEMKPHQYGVGGKAWPLVVQERRTQQEARE